ncbi:uncharacterized protein LOC115442651 isoform X2 [Manduca sexta]|uniref:uncharacterized protein LOC115442651 isoform X2 n=1 Tax=Manduca sexta TaxID=7130 RepID=UPI00188E4755|nr:uncharacterized protein LOC115442651 isoform X2 [Manduca sexta]
MKRAVVLFSALVLAVYSLPFSLPEPGQLALLLSEDDFEDYLDTWLEIEGTKQANILRSSNRNGCSIRVNGDLGQPQPVYLQGNNYLIPSGNTGIIHLNTGEQVYLACTGSNRLLRHPNISASTATGTATCVNNSLVSGAGWLNGHGEFGQITCSSHSEHNAEGTPQRCYNNNLVIRVGFIVHGVFYPLYWSCFDQYRLEVLYVWYEQNPQNAAHQTSVDRPNWLAGSFFPGVSVNNMYTQAQQKTTIAKLVGTDLANKYITSTQYLARGHLAAKTDFIYATGQRATFYFINSAPQWQPFNAGNWNWLEQVVYDSSRRIGTAFVGVNNPYYTESEMRTLQFCTDRCRNNSAFNWIGWQPDRIDLGYSFCCTINDFRRVVPHLPSFTVNGLLS